MKSGDISRWVLEFLLRDTSIGSNLIKQVLHKIPFPNNDSRLKIILILRTLEDYISTLSISQPILQILELLEELYRSHGSPITPAMASAYCAVAVYSTLHHNNGAYLDAVNRIWKGRVQFMNGSGSGEVSLMFSPELERWRNDIEVSILDLQLRQRLASLDSRSDAFLKLRVFLNEAWADLGPSFLEVATNNAVASEHLGPQHQQTVVEFCSSAAAEQEHLSTTIEVQKDGECSPSELQTSVNDLNEVLVENKSGDVDMPCPDGINDNEADFMVNDQTSLPQSCDHRPSLMEKNSTAHTYEWDDSIDGLQDGTSDHARLHLPSPKRRKLSPLKRYDYESPSITKRRPNKKWSQLEEETLKTAVDEFGVGNWKLILNSHKDVFEERTEVDLKDKWRNMTRYRGN